jgi:tripartite motif-containing protein 71
LISLWYGTTRKPLTDLPGLSQETPHYSFSIYGVSNPLGVAVTPSGDRIYVTESNGDRVVRVYDRSGKAIGTLKPPASTGGSHVPVYVAINPTNNDVYVSDRTTASIYVYDKAGTYLRPFDAKGDLGGGWAPLGLAFDAKARLYVTDVRGTSHRVLVFGSDGLLQRSLGLPGQLSFPNGVVVDPRGNVEVSDSNNGRLVVFAPDGKMVATITRGVGEGDLGLPRGTAIDDRGRLYVVDTSNHTVRMYRIGDAKSAAPKYIGSFGEEGTVDGRFEFPNGIATDNRARVYITDRENNRIQVWSY